MRSLYPVEVKLQKVDQRGERRVRLFLQLAVLAFWGPCSTVDLFLLWRDRGGDGAYAFVFGLLFRQALVFLALWFTVSLAHGLLHGAPDEAPRRRRRKTAGEPARSITPVRYNRGQ